ncbi:hypothetical protein HYPSUDRAFT_571593 [Hypholoma sublateritium FD-334 SS-4]|uniref:Secreted protein n=1 Tax=Hypholoma sublateritium (strain FD-334 SS-4) TaxID=945553 RepID=A0A0D2NYG1_HYPSF|nr:hypothetical protein HYPSUDRAFT_571593 [Hypholoma sublateritium FD-334 SS-4]
MVASPFFFSITWSLWGFSVTHHDKQNQYWCSWFLISSVSNRLKCKKETLQCPQTRLFLKAEFHPRYAIARDNGPLFSWALDLPHGYEEIKKS